MTTTERSSATRRSPQTGTADAVPVAARRSRTTVTLGPFLVALTERDRQERRPTVAVALAYVAPDAPERSAGAVGSVQARLRQVLAAVPVTGLREVAEALYDGLAEATWPVADGDPVQHGLQISHVAVSLLPRDLTSGRIQPVATVSVTNPDLVPSGAA